ncbi:hypothetical protein IT570_09835 [Candidatus Sumerlaeota bacterium]|nr:hypothetical protein [Candidatus Sumerlaeota bacterium]
MGAKIGAALKYLFNINTIWALMILVSFLVATVRQYTPESTLLPAAKLVQGDNHVTIAYNAKNNADNHQRKDFIIRNDNGTITLPPETTKAPDNDSQLPWLLDVRKTEKGDVLRWRTYTYGKYTVELNSPDEANKAIIAKGSLVTVERMTDVMFDYSKKAFDLGIGLVAAFVFLLGLMKVGEDAGIVDIVARAVGPIIRFLFPGIPAGHPANGAIVMSVTTGIFGLGNASTPIGLKAISELQRLNPRKDTATDAMCMFVGYNTAGFSLIPTSIIATMKSAGTISPLAIIGPSIIAGLASTIAAIIAVRVLGALPMFKVKYTQEELAAVAAENSGLGSNT